MGADKNFFPKSGLTQINSKPNQQSSQDHVASEKLLTLGTRSTQRKKNRTNRAQDVASTGRVLRKLNGSIDPTGRERSVGFITNAPTATVRKQRSKTAQNAQVD